VLAFTMVRDEASMLPRWIDHYGRSLGFAQLLIVDDGSTDGSTDSLPCSVIRVSPTTSWKPNWKRGRRRLVNSLAQAMLACYDTVIFTDVDEFLVPDPVRYSGLLDFLQRNGDDVIAPVAVNVLHDERSEPPLEPARPVLQQRSLVKFAPNMCKPSIKRVDAEWSPGFHGINARFRIRPDLLMLHLKYADAEQLRRSAAVRHALFKDSERGSKASAWSRETNELTTLLRSWTRTAGTSPPLEFDPYDLDAAKLVRRQGHTRQFRAIGSQLNAMSKQPLRTVPDRYRVV
jgi:hypothetical protein